MVGSKQVAAEDLASFAREVVGAAVLPVSDLDAVDGALAEPPVEAFPLVSVSVVLRVGRLLERSRLDRQLLHFVDFLHRVRDLSEVLLGHVLQKVLVVAEAFLLVLLDILRHDSRVREGVLVVLVVIGD